MSKISQSSEPVSVMNDREKGFSGSRILRETIDEQAYPDIGDLIERLKFSPDKGHIWLDKRRMFLLHNRAFGALRHNMIELFGTENARSVLMRTGYTAGSLDGEMASKVRDPKDFFAAFSVGPQMHALLGITLAKCVSIEADVANGKFYGEYIWYDSIEDDAHLRFFDIGADPACWFQIGYASGYSSVLLGRPIIFREVECRSQGFQECRIVGKLAQQWDDISMESKILQPQMSDMQNTALQAEADKPTQHPIKMVDLQSLKTPSETPDERFVGSSAGFQVAYNKLRKVAQTDATVLFLGESGVGKEVFAQKLHRMSARASGPFIPVNCAAIPETLIESELFGVEKGAYTGAVSSRMGRFERAAGGTLFLDEIGCLNISAQGKLLRAIQEREIERVGDTRTRIVDTRVVAATNVDLLDAVKEGTFREDLYYRLNVFPVTIPPLRERKQDIPLLIDFFFRNYCQRHKRAPSGFTERAVHALFTYDWPGNIREMENIIERAVILADPGCPIDNQHLFTAGERLNAHLMSLGASGQLEEREPDPQDGDDLPIDPTKQGLVEQLLGGNQTLDDIEHQLIRGAIDRSNGNLSKAARLLGITRPQLAYRLKKIEM